MVSKIGKGEWIILFTVVGVIDLIQWVIIEGVLVWFFGIGAAVNEIIDPIVGSILGFYLQFRGVEVLRRYNRLLALVGTEALAALTGGFYQFWILALWYIYADVKKEEAASIPPVIDGPLYQNGRRRPSNVPPPLNSGGSRPPRKV